MKVFFSSFGCKVNSSENRYFLSVLKEKGFVEAENVDDTDIIVINTCAVTQIAAKKSKNHISKMRERNRSAKIIVTGCLAEEYGIVLKETGADIVVSNGSKSSLTEHILNLSDGFTAASEGAFSGGAVINASEGKTRAFFKIQDGCDAMCSYCIIPFLRGEPKSMPIEDAERNFRSLLSLGYKEIVLVGIHIGLYGRELGYNIYSLLKRLAEMEGDFRIRLTSIEVNEIDDSLLSLIAENDKICRHLHIPLQSGSDRILSLMNRRYKRRDYMDTVLKARSAIPDITIGSDIIAGFPDESENDFKDTLDCLAEAGTDFFHAFPYSERPGTPASSMENKVPLKERHNRSEIIREQGRLAQLNLYERLIGKKMRVLTEKGSKGHADNYVLIHFDKKIAANKFIDVRAEYVKDGKLYGNIL